MGLKTSLRCFHTHGYCTERCSLFGNLASEHDDHKVAMGAQRVFVEVQEAMRKYPDHPELLTSACQYVYQLLFRSYSLD